MAYLIESWLRFTDASNNHAAGEELHRKWRAARSADAAGVLDIARRDFAVCRVTLSHISSATMWDLYRTSDRDRTLDNSLRQLASPPLLNSTILVQAANNVTQSELRTAIGDMLTTIPGNLK